MSTIVTRAGKGSPLTNNEVDANFVNLNTDKIESITSADGSVVITPTGTARDLSVAISGSTTNVVVLVRNTTGATLTKGTAVYISGATGQISTVSKALATGDSTSAQTLGLISADIANNTNGYVTVIGLITNINTSAYTDGAQLYLSGVTAGTLTATKPYAPIHLVYVAVVEYAHATQGKLFVKVQNGYEMDELHNVSAQSPTTGQTLVYNASNSLWEKNTVSLTAGVNGVLPTANGGTNLTSFTSGGVVYASSSSVLATGSALTFDGTTQTIETAYGNSSFRLQRASVASQYALLRYGSSAGNYGLTFDSIDGSASTPSFLWRTSVDGSTFTEQLRLTSSSLYTASGINVGIGTDTPLSRFNIKGVQGNWRIDADSVSSEIQLLATNTINTGFLNYRIKTNETIFDTSGSERLRITSAGNFLKQYGLEYQSYTSGGSVSHMMSYGTWNGTGNLLVVGNTFDGIVFGTGGGTMTEKGRFNAAGNLGVGSNDPQAKIHAVKTEQQTDIDASAQVLLLENTSTDTPGNLSGIRFRQTNGTNAANTFIGISSTGNSATRARLVFAPPNPSGNSTERMTILSSGNVGIGQNNPQSILDVSSPATVLRLTSTTGTNAVYQRITNDAGQLYFGIDNSAGNDLASGSTAYAGVLVAPGTTRNLHFGTNGTVQATITPAGNVLIGTLTNTNSSKLVVNGTISQTVGGTQYQVVDQSDIGTAPNEIPLNQYLGSLAYQNGDAYYNTGMTVGFRNRIINGAMMIDQRNAGASVTINTTQIYVTDRWVANARPTGGGVYSAQQVSDAPVGFSNSLKLTVTTADTSLAAFDYYFAWQKIEGFNTIDLLFGTTSAKTVTLSFWVKSSVIGQFSAFLSNQAESYSCPISYTINTANIWEYKTITFGGATAGTWIGATNGTGLIVGFGLATGTSLQGTSNTWVASGVYGSTGDVNWMATNGATFQVTGVQLEKGNIATSFDVRPYGTEFQLCQRYFQQIQTTGGNQRAIVGTAYSSTQCVFLYTFETTMRAQATITIPNLGQVLKEGIAWYTPTSWNLGSVTTNFANVEAFLSSSAFSNNDFAWWGQTSSILKITASAEL